MNNQQFLGGICERGIIDNMNLTGMNSIYSVNEILQNSYDARIPGKIFTIKIIKRQNGNIAFIDNCFGIDIEGMKKALTLAEKTKFGKQVGIAGMGLQNSLKFLARGKYHCRVIGMKEGGEFLSYDIPWDIIIEQGNMNQCFPSENIERIKKQFEEDRNPNEIHGVTIELINPYENLWDELLTFLTPDINNEKKTYEEFKNWPHNSLGYTSKVMNDIIIYDERQNKNLLPYKRYNVGDLSEQETYVSNEMVVHIYKNVKNDTLKKYVGKMNGKYFEVKPKSSGYAKEPEIMDTDPYVENKDYIAMSDLTLKFKTNIQKDENYFDIDNPKTLGGGKHCFPLQKDCGWENEDTFLNNNQYTQICRNGIVINDTLAHEKHLNPRSSFEYRKPVLVASLVSVDYPNDHKDVDYINNILGLSFVKNTGRPILPTELRRLLLFCITSTANNFNKIVDDVLKKEADLKAKKEADLKAKKETELKAKKEAELKAKKETELKAKKEAELKAKKEKPEEKQPEEKQPEEKQPEEKQPEEKQPEEKQHEEQEPKEQPEEQEPKEQPEEQQLEEPNKRKIGPGEQTRQTKRNVILTFENEIPKRIKEIEDPEDRKEYERDVSELIYEMLMDKCDPRGNRQPFVRNRFRHTNWKELIPELWEYNLNNKLDDEEVAGGSRLHKFMKK
jgi:hypothetical protein